MKNNKTLWLSLVLFILTIVLVACGGDNNTSEENNGSDGGADKITIFQSKVEITEPLEELAEIYEDETGVEVEIWGTTGSDYEQQLEMRLSSNQGPSIFTTSGLPQLEKIESYVYDISDEDYVTNIAEGMELELNDKIYGVPYGVEGYGLIYNKDLVSPEDVTDLDSFEQTLKKFHDEGINGLGIAGDGVFFLIGHMSGYPFSLQDDNYEFIQKLNEGEVTMTETPEFQEFGEFWDVIKKYTPNPLDTSYDEQVGDFATGKSAMIHQGNWAYNMFEDYDLDFDMGIMPFPLMGTDKLAVGVASHWSINANKDDAEIEAANDFLEWMFTSETGQEYIVDEFKFIPALTNIEAENLDPLSETVFKASNEGETIPWSHPMYPSNMIKNNLGTPAQEFFLEEDMTGEEFIQNLQDAWMEGVGKQN